MHEIPIIDRLALVAGLSLALSAGEKYTQLRQLLLTIFLVRAEVI